jgi:uncharacterized protein (DUF433 family)
MAHDRIESKPTIMFGKPVIKGTRIPVDRVLRMLGSDMTPDQIVEALPALRREDVLAAASYAADYVAGEEVVPSEETEV